MAHPHLKARKMGPRADFYIYFSLFRISVTFANALRKDNKFISLDVAKLLKLHHDKNPI